MGSEIQRWADKAMFESEPMPEATKRGPQVHLLWMTPDPLGAIAAACKMYKGEVVRSLSDVTHAEREDYFRQVNNTILKAPFEFVQFHFMIEGVDRSYTHQAVRQRTATFAQESLRFAVKDRLDEEVSRPPSLRAESEDHRWNRIWDSAINKVEDAYHALIDDGMPAEDARGLLPHATTTRMHYRTDLRALQDHLGNRLCTQAQFHWRIVASRIAQAIREYQPHAAMIKSMFPDGERPTEKADKDALHYLRYLDAGEAWQYEAISGLFKPVCYLTGKCEFMANFDRSCSIRERVNKFHSVGMRSDEWEKTIPDDMQERLVPVEGLGLEPIRPGEWLLDPGAAR